jgi:hypothetical protein
MIKKGIIIDTMRFTIERECTYDDTVVESMFYKVDGKDLIPAAYVYPAERKVELELNLETMREIKKEYEDRVAIFYYQVLPKMR